MRVKFRKSALAWSATPCKAEAALAARAGYRKDAAKMVKSKNGEGINKESI